MNGKTKSLIACLAINAIALCAFARAESANQEFKRGKALFDKGQTQEALQRIPELETEDRRTVRGREALVVVQQYGGSYDNTSNTKGFQALR